MLIFPLSLYAQIPDIEFEHISTEQGLSEGSIYAILQDDMGFLWFGTKDGLNKYDGYNFIYYKSNPSDSTSLSDNHVYSILQDSRGVLWIGTFSGLNKFDRFNEKFTHFLHNRDDPYSLSENRVREIYEDKEGVIWIGTDDGLNSINPVYGKNPENNSPQFIHYYPESENENSLSDNRIWSIHEDENGNLWLGTNGGVNRFDKTTEKFVHYTEEHGLPNNVVYGIVDDVDGNLWLSTNNGISKFNPNTLSFINYDVKDGLQGNEFNPGAYLKTREGKIYFGGKNGFNSFYPQKIKNNPHIPPIVLTAFKKFNNPVKLDTTISETNTLKLSYRENFFAFAFAALNYLLRWTIRFLKKINMLINSKDLIQIGY
jgi:ligand-binding sensor domain-containing protein